MKVYREPIPCGKLKQFDEILKACGGRYLCNPEESPDRWGYWRVSFEYEDVESANEHYRRWYRVLKPVVERRAKKSIAYYVKKLFLRLCVCKMMV